MRYIYYFSTFLQLTHGVKFKLELENYTKCVLSPGANHIHTGEISGLPAALQGGEKHGVVGHKSGTQSATGCCGVLSWEIADADDKLVIMYSIPYDQNLYSNWIGVGLYPKGDNPQFDDMYDGDEDNFKRKDFYYNMFPVSFSNEKFKVEGTCESTHTPTIVVKLHTKNES